MADKCCDIFYIQKVLFEKWWFLVVNQYRRVNFTAFSCIIPQICPHPRKQLKIMYNNAEGNHFIF